MSFTDEVLASQGDNIERDIGDLIQISSRALPQSISSPATIRCRKARCPITSSIGKASVRSANFPPKPLFANTMRR